MFKLRSPELWFLVAAVLSASTVLWMILCEPFAVTWWSCLLAGCLTAQGVFALEMVWVCACWRKLTFRPAEEDVGPLSEREPRYEPATPRTLRYLGDCDEDEYDELVNGPAGQGAFDTEGEEVKS